MPRQALKKPAETRQELCLAIFEQAEKMNWSGADLMRHTFTFFTAVDLKLILEGMRQNTSGNGENLH
jgi:phosphoribosyl-ATP pyrophosphohydrolase